MRLTLLSLTVFLFIYSCKHEEELVPQEDPNEDSRDLCDTTKVYFQNDILPILVSSCAFSGCHDAGTGTAGVILSTYDNLTNSNVVTAGDPDNSKLYKRITETNLNDRMPLGANRLAQENIDKIRQWILDGAENSFCHSNTKCDTTNITFSGSILKIVQQKCQGCHHGFQPGGGIDLTTYNGIKAIAIDQRLLNVVLHAPGFKAMPLGGQMLPECEIEAIRVWTSAGAPNN